MRLKLAKFVAGRTYERFAPGGTSSLYDRSDTNTDSSSLDRKWPEEEATETCDWLLPLKSIVVGSCSNERFVVLADELAPRVADVVPSASR